MKNLFNSVMVKKPNSNVFDLSHDVKMSLNMGLLYPFCNIDCVPGDKFNLSCESLLRFQPLVAPIMHRVDVSMHYFFVPYRLLWPNWEKFITNTLVGGNLPAVPYLPVTSASWNPLQDYLGIPQPIGGGTINLRAFEQAAYQMIYHEYYRDQNLVPEFDYKLVDGNNVANATILNQLRRRAWEHDYFTAALPFAQKGAGVDLPLGDITLNEDWNIGAPGAEPWPHFKDQANTPLGGAAGNVQTGTNGSGDAIIAGGPGGASFPTVYDPNGSLEVSATTINDLRRAFRLQEWLEKAARGGSRYIESILSHFGVRSSDKRLQRPEYITGVKTPVMISEVLNTTGTTDAPQGSMAGHGVSAINSRYGNYFCEEHGVILGLCSVMPKTAYSQGIPKQFLKIDDPFQYYWPSFAHIGEQEVLNKEVYASTAADGDEIFGYVPRYAEHKFVQSRVAGDFRDSLNFWHMGREFSSMPALNEDFVSANPTTRIFAVEGADDHVLMHIFNRVKAVRRMPKFGTPSY